MGLSVPTEKRPLTLRQLGSRPGSVARAHPGAGGQIRAATAIARLFAGALGAAGYALACTETSPGFVAAWYSLGIGLTAALGAIVGPRVLRW